MRLFDGALSKTKEYFVKIYDENGNMLTSAFDIGFERFKKSINGGLGELTLNLARPFDDFGEGTEIDFMHQVKLYVVDAESGPEGAVVYSGFIDQYEPYATGRAEGVTVRCLGYVTNLSNNLYRNGGTISMTHSTSEVATIVSDILSKYQAAVAASPIASATGSIENTGTTVSYTFNSKTCFEALETCRELAPADWFWYVDENNILYFKEKPDTPTHTFTFKGDIGSIHVQKSIRDVCNYIIVWNGLMPEDADLLCRAKADTTSITNYWRRMEMHTDGRLMDSTTMDAFAAGYLAAKKDPNVRVTLTVIDSNLNSFGYDIESVSPGDTCRIKNLPESSTTFDDNMIITDVTYYTDRIDITLQDMRQMLTSKFSDVIKELKTHVYTDGPASYTVV